MYLEEEIEKLKEQYDTKEERVAYKDRAIAAIKKHKYQIGIGFILIALVAFANEKKADIQKSLTETKIVEKVVYKDRVVFIDNMMCSDLSKMYTIANKEVIYKKRPHMKLAKGITLENGTEVYITKYDPIIKKESN